MNKLVRYRAEALAQYMEALRADGGVGFSRLPRTEAGLQSASVRTDALDTKDELSNLF